MRTSTALRLATAIIVAKAALIGFVSWRRAQLLGQPWHFGAGSVAGLIGVIAIAIAIAAPVYVAAKHYNRRKAD